MTLLGLHGLLTQLLDDVFIGLFQHGKVLKSEIAKIVGQCGLAESSAA